MMQAPRQEPEPIGFAVAYAARRNRLTVAFRIILVIPQLIVTSLLEIVSLVVVVISWFGAIIAGYLPRWAGRFQVGCLGWYTRVVAYLFLVVDAYPPFELAARPGYPLQLGFPVPTRLNRAAVLFRLIVGFPAWVVSTLAGAGLGIASVPIWVMLVVTGRMPRPVFQAMATVLRYQVRFFAYGLALLTPAYPGGLFAEPLLCGDWGDATGVTSGAAPVQAPIPPAPPATAAPPAAPPATAMPPAPATPPAPAPPAPPATAMPPAAATPPASAGLPGWPGMPGLPEWPGPQADLSQSTVGFGDMSWPVLAVPLSAWAKVMVAALLALGLAGEVLDYVYVSPNVFNISALEATANLFIAHQNLESSDQTALDDFHSCLGRSVAFSCDQAYDAAQGSAYAAYASALSAISYPSSARADASTLVAEVRKAAKAFLYVSAASNQGALQAESKREGLDRLEDRVQRDYARLDDRLS